jgi:hypothetical protein
VVALLCRFRSSRYLADGVRLSVLALQRMLLILVVRHIGPSFASLVVVLLDMPADTISADLYGKGASSYSV